MLTDHCTGYTAFATGYIYSSLLSTLLGVPLETDSFKLRRLGFLASGFSLGLAVGSSSERGQEEREEKVLSCSLWLWSWRRGCPGFRPLVYKTAIECTVWKFLEQTQVAPFCKMLPLGNWGAQLLEIFLYDFL